MANASGATGVIAIGEQAAMSATSASTGIFIGQRAGRGGTSTSHYGTTNTIAIGNNSFFSGTNIINCIAIGTDAAKFQHIASDTINIGREAGYAISGHGHGGHHANTMQGINIGYQAGSYPTINHLYYPYANGAEYGQAQGVINIGRQAGKLNTNPDDINIGAAAGFNGRWKPFSGSGYNVNIGYSAGCFATSGKDNVRLGSHAGYSAMMASHSIAIGAESLYSGANATYGIAMGRGSSQYFIGGDIGNTNADAPLALGHYSNQFKTGETQNTYIGNYAGRGGSIANITPQTGQHAGDYKESQYQVGVGNGALQGTGGQTWNSDYVVAIGYRAGYVGLGNSENTTLIGAEAGGSVSSFGGGKTTAIGYKAAYAATSSKESIFVGNQAGHSASRQDNSIYIGMDSGYFDSNGSYNTHLGHQAAYNANSNSFSISMGLYSMYDNRGAQAAIFIGEYAGYSGTQMNSTTAIGSRAGYSGRSDYNSTFIGESAGRVAGWQAAGNTTRGYNVAVGTSALDRVTGATHCVAVGPNAAESAGNPWQGYVTQGNIPQDYNIYVGAQTAQWSRSSEHNIGIGYSTMSSARTANENIAIGRNSTFYGSMKAGATGAGGGRNIAIGKNSFYSGTTAEDSISIGASASYLGGGSYNIALGNYSLTTATGSTGSDHMLHDSNISIGNKAAQFMLSGTSNIFIGRGAGSVPDEVSADSFREGANNIYVGTFTQPGVGNASGANAKGFANHRENSYRSHYSR